MPKTKNNELTARQREVLDFIKGYIAEKYPPTLAEVSDHFGFSEKAAHDHLIALERKGVIRRYPSIPRGIKIMDAGGAEPSEPEELTIEITPKINVVTEGFSEGEYIRLRRQSAGDSGDIVLLERADGTLALQRLTGHNVDILGRVVGHTFAVE